VFATSKEFYIYDGKLGYYVNDGAKFQYCNRVRRAIRNTYRRTYIGKDGLPGHDPAPSFINAVLQYFVDEHTVDKDKVFPNLLDILPVKNGVLDLKTRKLIPHSPDNKLLYTLNVEYNPDAKCSVFEGFLSNVKSRGILSDEKTQELLEFFAYCLIPNSRLEAGMILVGEPGSGKSTFIDILLEILGACQYASETMHDLEEYPFSTANLEFKLLNVCSDIGERPIRQSPNLKKIMSGEPLNANRKGIQPYPFKPYARLLFAANVLPELSEEDEALYRRLLLVRFIGNVTLHERDVTLKEKLKSPSELSGFLNILLDAHDALNERGDFTGRLDIYEMKKLYQELKNPLKNFVEDCLIPIAGRETIKDEAYTLYRDTWCPIKKKVPMSSSAFKTAITKNNNQFPTGKSNLAGRPTIWKNCLLKPKEIVEKELGVK
jgi:putative DNA primase/helicase